MKLSPITGLLVVCMTTTLAQAEVTRIEITQRRPYAEGRPMGDRGPYEQLRGRIYFAIDPKLPANGNIVDLDLAPRNAQGHVEFQADVELLAPVDRSRGNGAALYEVNNRGGKTAPGIFNGGADEFLLRQGFVVVWSGWIAEVLPGGERLLFQAPPALEGGKPVRGIVRNEWIVDRSLEKASISHRGNQAAYRPVPELEDRARLTMRVNEADSRVEVPRDQWRFIVTDVEVDGRKGQLPLVEVAVTGGLKPGAIYEVVYEAEGSVVQGTGLAGIRDLVSLLKYDRSERNPLRQTDGSPLVKRAHGFGTSQSGRLLRQLLYDGFNADEQRRQVLDGVISHVAGGGLGFFNHRFASPTRTNGQHEEHLFPADYFPFTYGESEDPFTHRVDGILKKCQTSKTMPKVMHTQSSSEYWHRSGSLVHTDPSGTRDAPIPDNVRIYSFGGTQHGAGSGLPSPRGGGQLPSNPSDYRPLMRALVMALDEWVRDGRQPPASVYPRIADGTLADWREAASGWRAVPEVAYPRVVHQPAFLDRGSEWFTKRIATREPPEAKGQYGVRVPAYGPDDNERGTLNLPSIVVPVATYTSWNLRHESIGAPGELLGLQGGYIPFAKTKPAREAAGDPRPALLERYRDFDDYQRQFIEAAAKLGADRYLLPEDLPRLKSLSDKHRPLFE